MKFVYRDIAYFLEQLKMFATEIAPPFGKQAIDGDWGG